MRSAQGDLQCSVLEAKEPAPPRLVVVDDMRGSLPCHLRVIAPRGQFCSGDLSILHYYLHEWLGLKQPVCHPRVLPAISERLALGDCWIMPPLLFAIRNPVSRKPPTVEGQHTAPALCYAPYPVSRRCSLSFAPGSGAKNANTARNFRNGRVWATRCGGCASFPEPMGVTDQSPPPLATLALPLTLWRPPQTSHSLRTLPRHPSAPVMLRNDAQNIYLDVAPHGAEQSATHPTSCQRRSHTCGLADKTVYLGLRPPDPRPFSRKAYFDRRRPV
jgi:hypothetical protein